MDPAAENERLGSIGAFIWAARERVLATAGQHAGDSPERVIECRLRGASMAGAIPAGSRIQIALASGPFQVGDVIAFMNDAQVVVHRIVHASGRRDAQGNALIITRGDDGKKHMTRITTGDYVPLAASRLRNILMAAWGRDGTGPGALGRTADVLREYARVYEARREQGLHNGPPLIEVQLCRMTWKVRTDASLQRPRSILCSPICTSAPRTLMAGTILRAMAPAATRIAVSRADWRPPPR